MSAPFFDRRVPFYSWKWVALATGASTLGVAGGAWAEWGETLGRALVHGAVAGLLVLALFALLLLTQLLGEGARVQVTDEGLKVGFRLIPIEQIVSVSAVPAGQVGRSILSYRVGQRKVGWFSKVVSYDTKAAVVVRDGRRQRRPWWLIDVDDPDRFIEAVRTAQENARSRGG